MSARRIWPRLAWWGVLLWVARAPIGGTVVRAAPVDLAIEHAHIHDGEGKSWEDGTLVVSKGRILAVGPAGEVAIPDGARRIDGRGKVVTPGLIDAESSVGLADVFAVQSSVETRLDESYGPIRAAFSVLDGLNPRSVVIPVTRLEGVTSTLVVPTQGLVSGSAAFVRLAGRRVPDMTLAAPAAMVASVAEGGRQAAFGARGGVFLRLRELMDDVRQYARRRQDFERNQMRKVAASRLDLEALIPVVERRLPLLVEVARASDILAVLRLAEEEKIRVILAGCEEGWLVADALAEARIPVIVSALSNLPAAFESLAARLENPALLAAAGVPLILSPRGRGDHTSRTLRLEAGNAVANGLPWAAALAAITATPARTFGLEREVGTLLRGRSADLVIWSGDPFEPLTRPLEVFIAGEPQPLVTRQTKLRDRYRVLRQHRPAP